MPKLNTAVCDNRCQQFYREVAKKEAKLKTLWFIKNKHRLHENVNAKLVSETLDNLKDTQQAKKKLADKKAAPVDDTVKQETSPPLWRPKSETGVMRPIPPSVRNILYVPKDESFAAKKNYFKERHKSNPEDRFYYPVCSSWVCGWRLKDYPSPPMSQVGRRAVIQMSFYRANASSLQRDPDWYRICQTADPNNFDELLTY